MIGERVLRPARVGIAKGGPRYSAAAEGPEVAGASEIQPGADQKPETVSPPKNPPPGPVSAKKEAAKSDTDSSEGSGVGGRVDRTA